MLLGPVVGFFLLSAFFAGASSLAGNYLTKRAWGREIAAERRASRLQSVVSSAERRYAARVSTASVDAWATARRMVREAKGAAR
jgi:hypothetical protein